MDKQQEHVPPQRGPPPARHRWRDWLPVAVIAALLLVLSQLVWMWQSWPVREQLESHPAPGETTP